MPADWTKRLHAARTATVAQRRCRRTKWAVRMRRGHAWSVPTAPQQRHDCCFGTAAMHSEERLEEQARTVGFVAIPCPRCRMDEAGCANCGGAHRVWADGPTTLSDTGIERLLAMRARMVGAGQRPPFRVRRLGMIHWPVRPAHDRARVSV
ncbi:hypothetical protein K2Z84_27110 [Candidatus Binatia bacterium]|nr:hypothetical protein [Candidatus Binatia bacterium]